MTILSHRYQFIFIKTKKVGGSAFSWYMDPLLGPNDIRANWPRKDKNIKGHHGFYNHMTVREFIELRGWDLWMTYLTVTIVRHPIDRLISEFYWSNRSGKFKSFSTFIRSAHVRGTFNYPILEIAPYQCADFNFIMRYERLPQDFNTLCTKTGIPRYRDLPQVKSGFRKDYRHWKEFVSKDDLTYIKQNFKRELELHKKEFGYDF